MRFSRRISPFSVFIWVIGALNILRRDPGAWFSIVSIYCLASYLILMVPFVGLILLGTLTPLLSVGIIYACTSRLFVHKIPSMKKILLIYRLKENFTRLGFIYYALLGFMILFLFLISMPSFLPVGMLNTLGEINASLNDAVDYEFIRSTLIAGFKSLDFGDQVQVIFVFGSGVIFFILFHLVGTLSTVYYFFYEKGVLFPIKASVVAFWKNLFSFIILSFFVLAVYILLMLVHRELIYVFSDYASGISVIFLFFGRVFEFFLIIVCIFAYFSIFGFENDVAEIQLPQVD